MSIPVVIATNGLGTPVRPVEKNAPVMTVADNGFGIPIVISDLGAPFIVSGLTPVVTSIAVIVDGDGKAWSTPDGKLMIQEYYNG